MSKLSPSQIEMLKFFVNDGAVELCTSIGCQLGATSFPKGKPSKFNKLVMNSLLKYGLLKPSREEYVYGLRWARVELTKRGLDVVTNLESSNEEI
ncbi:hypothetical protein [Alteromonas sp. R78001]|uniref:hypothetical protein n=1 Tax=Alteromonas sp. R78001 TaxID=3093865 RepID=UPI00367190B3